jgi:D-alanine-D-alanine ligase
MNTKKNIALVYGGDSSEAEVSERSATNVLGWIDTTRYTPYMVRMVRGDWQVRHPNGQDSVPVLKSDFSAEFDGQKVSFDVALIVIHGAPGENGVLQAYFDVLGVPYTTCSAFVSALTFNKFACKAFIAHTGVAMAKSMLIRRGEDVNPHALAQQLGLPLFVKPNNGGSSFGITKVKHAADLQPALDKALADDGEALVEEFIGGVEVTCGAMSLGGVETVLPVTEVVSQNEFFDYGAKYEGMSDEITPARIGAEATALVQRTTQLLYRRLGCNGIVRIDYILRHGTPYFLEINTVPGMTAASFIPQQIQAAKMEMVGTISLLLEDAYNRLPHKA